MHWLTARRPENACPILEKYRRDLERADSRAACTFGAST
jgi:hypothetical protein